MNFSKANDSSIEIADTEPRLIQSSSLADLEMINVKESHGVVALKGCGIRGRERNRRKVESDCNVEETHSNGIVTRCKVRRDVGDGREGYCAVQRR
jgi:hypothetical protein